MGGHKKAAKTDGLTARVEINWPPALTFGTKRYTRASASTVDLPRTLEDLRSLDFDAPDGQNAAAHTYSRIAVSSIYG